MALGLGLSDRQKSTLAAALTIVAIFVIVGFIGAILWVLGAFVSRFSNVFLPLAVAAVVALVLKPFYELLTHRLGMPAAIGLIAVFLAILIPVGAFLGVFGTLAVNQVTDIVEEAPENWQRVRTEVETRWPKVVQFFEESEYGQILRSAFEGQESAIARQVQKVSGQAWTVARRALGAIGALLNWAVVPVYLAFFLMFDPIKPQHLDDALPFLREETRRDVVYLVKEFINILVAFFRGQLIVAFLQGCLFALGFSLVGLKYGFVLGIALGFLNIIPYLGSIVGLGVALPLAFFQAGGGFGLVVGVVVVFVVVQLIEGYLLTPRVMGERTGLHPMAIIVAVFFWGSALGGISGMILAIPLTAFLVLFWRLLKEKYIHELV